jgi:hypothetical protein
VACQQISAELASVSESTPTVDRVNADDGNEADRSLELDLIGKGRVPLYYVPPRVADGWYLVHNKGRPEDPLDLHGCRIWLQESITPAMVECDCGWQARLGVHYRFDLSVAVEHYRSLGLIN